MTGHEDMGPLIIVYCFVFSHALMELLLAVHAWHKTKTHVRRRDGGFASFVIPVVENKIDKIKKKIDPCMISKKKI